jgi:hypothetical protein
VISQIILANENIFLSSYFSFSNPPQIKHARPTAKHKMPNDMYIVHLRLDKTYKPQAPGSDDVMGMGINTK